MAHRHTCAAHRQAQQTGKHSTQASTAHRQAQHPGKVEKRWTRTRCACTCWLLRSMFWKTQSHCVRGRGYVVNGDMSCSTHQSSRVGGSDSSSSVLLWGRAVWGIITHHTACTTEKTQQHRENATTQRNRNALELQIPVRWCHERNSIAHNCFDIPVCNAVLVAK